MTGLLLRLAGPMQSWGEHSAFGERDTLAFPSRSGLVGMFAAAQGVGREEGLERYDGLRLLVRVDARGVRMTDFHTVGGGLPRERTVPTAEGKRRPEGATTIVTRRAYLADAVFTVAVSGPGSEDIGRSLLSPHWQTYLGRRSFVPDPLLVLRVQAPDPEHELRTAVPLPRRRVPQGQRTVEVELVSEQVSTGAADTGGRTVLNDVPRSFASAHRRYTSREVLVERTALSADLVSDSIRQYQERLLAYVKEHR
ncbi:type I-E CRISPR-associated protein Cas5/CasD [Nocardiopsis sp. CT-R113]|uniref:Type I-E CRISPR-associated protein Cas5/CasD n=1 Tax=Nocardiopsis codii TaxID=3065942 RepID=A0ABU7K520_9ACTN|nr:type I-E CRISPR-associated protein Cas5/CasD [Nocardiopsis sp. CT-R113]MEE2037337.1 type I-E CRISPR-associated protein Cas5/CasD [Nocardiopsis sp. CT-R113]